MIVDRIKKSEGFRAKPYLCPAGKLTIGYGRNIEDNGITEAEASFLLYEDLLRADMECRKSFTWFKDLNEARQGVLVEMCFNMGLARLRSFKKMLACVSRGDYDGAAAEMLDSRWARQVGQRANNLANIMKKGTEDAGSIELG